MKFESFESPKKEIILPKALQKVNEMKDQIQSAGGMTLIDHLASLETNEVFKYKKIVVAGPPRSGKSCFNAGIKDAIISIPDAPYPFIHTACPDGEGSWFQKTMNLSPELATTLKAEYKSKFTPEFVQMQSEAVKKLGSESCPLNFVDIGGIITPENAKICEGANAAIILAGEDAITAKLPAEWKKFFDNLNIPVIAEVYSDYKGTEDTVVGVGEDGVFRGSVHHLERGENLSSRQTLIELANHVLTFEKLGDTNLNADEITKEILPNIDNQWAFDGKRLTVSFPREKAPIDQLLRDTEVQIANLFESNSKAIPDSILVEGPITIMSAAFLAEKLSKFSANISFSDNEGSSVRLNGEPIWSVDRTLIEEIKSQIKIEKKDDTLTIKLPPDRTKKDVSVAFIEKLKEFIQTQEKGELVKVNGKLTTPAGAGAGLVLSKHFKTVAFFYPPTEGYSRGVYCS